MAEELVQRKLAAILAADVVGYSRLMRADEDGTLAQLKILRKSLLHPKVEEYGGRIVKTTGDIVLIEFPSAVDAVEHVVDVQQALARRRRASRRRYRAPSLGRRPPSASRSCATSSRGAASRASLCP